MSDSQFISHAQNREDVVLWRALGSIRGGRYVEVGANDPNIHSITKAFYDRGWCGITVEPDPVYAAKHRAERPRDIMVEAAVADRDGEVTLHLIPGTGLSTLKGDIGERHAADGREVRQMDVEARRLHDIISTFEFDEREVHVLIVDVEGAEAEVLRTADLHDWRPWVLVIEATQPLTNQASHESWEPDVLGAGYQFCLFDGISRFYVAEEHAEALADSLSYPACVLDVFVDAEVSRREVELCRLREQIETSYTQHVEEVIRWRTAALGAWANQVGETMEIKQLRGESEMMRHETAAAHREVHAIHETVSWRVTKPLRAARRLRSGGVP